MATPKYRIENSKRWSKTHVRQYLIKLIVGRDDAMIAKLDEEKNKTDYIRKLYERGAKEKGKR
jgi:hypothetical protein